jgi:hypothetical protein
MRGQRKMDKKKGWAYPNLLRVVRVNPKKDHHFLVLVVLGSLEAL